jgi:hypothetical protein
MGPKRLPQLRFVTGWSPPARAEARESLAHGKAVLPLGGFGGAARDVARQLGLVPTDARRADVFPQQYA